MIGRHHESSAAILRKYNIHPERGFLPASNPITQLSAEFTVWEEIAKQLPKLLAADRFRPVIESLTALEVKQLQDEQEIERAMLLLSYFGHAYVWGGAQPRDCLPAGLAIPWYAVSQLLGRPPVLSYASHALSNWAQLDPQLPIALGNIFRLQNFLGGLDEDWFVLVHIGIEAKAGPALQAVVEGQRAVLEDDRPKVEQALRVIAEVLQQMYSSLTRMPEKCDPYIYYTRVRPFIFGWKDNPALPEGVRYEGVLDYQGRYQKFRGETGAQSSIIPALDAAIGINYEENPLSHHLLELRDYMPPKHRMFMEFVEHGPSIREYVLQNRSLHASLRDAYNACIHGLQQFRGKHLEYAGLYIHAQSQRADSNPVNVGTGGTPFMQYLKQHCSELNQYMIV